MAKTVSVICLNCGKEKVVPVKEFNRWRSSPNKKWFCDSKCAASYKKASHAVSSTCPVCKKVFTKTIGDPKVYCSKHCANIQRFAALRVREASSEVHKNGYLRSHTAYVHPTEPRYCAYCKKPLSNPRSQYCSRTCWTAHHWSTVFTKIETSGIFPTTTYGETDRRVAKKFIGTISGYRCAICDKTACKLVVDHIDGDACNSHVENVRLLCVECDRNTPTYKNRPHKANRPWRRKTKVA